MHADTIAGLIALFMLAAAILVCCACCYGLSLCIAHGRRMWRRLRLCLSSFPYYHVVPLGSSTRSQFRAAIGRTLRDQSFRRCIDAYDQAFFWTADPREQVDVSAKLRPRGVAFSARNPETAALVRSSSILILVDDRRSPLRAGQLSPLISVSCFRT